MNHDLQFFEKFYQTNSQWWRNKYISWAEIAAMRDNLTNENCWQTLTDFIAIMEGYMEFPYQDGAHYSIGYGLLFKRCEKNEYEALALNIFQQVGINLYNFIPISIFNLPKAEIIAQLKQYRLTKAQCLALLKYTLQYNQSLLEKQIMQFQKLPLGLQIAMHSMWYNSPALIGPNMKHILRDYIASGNQIYLLDCICEIECNSNPANSEYYLGLQNRRYKEAVMCGNRIIDFITYIPDKYFEKFLASMKQDTPNTYSHFENHFYLIENNIPESVKLAALLGYMHENIFPDMQYILDTMRIIAR